MRNPVALQKRSTFPALLRYSPYAGVQFRVAKKLKVHKSVVSRVASGQTTSKRISKALAREISRIEQEIARRVERAA